LHRFVAFWEFNIAVDAYSTLTMLVPGLTANAAEFSRLYRLTQ